MIDETILQITEDDAADAVEDGIMCLICPVTQCECQAEPDAQDTYCEACDCVHKINNWLC